MRTCCELAPPRENRQVTDLHTQSNSVHDWIGHECAVVSYS